jgi:hypothetical protein
VRDFQAPEVLSRALPPRVVDLFDPSLLGNLDMDQFASFSVTHSSSPANRASAASARGGGAAPQPPAEEMLDPDWREGKLKDGTAFWFKVDDPQNPTFKKPLVSALAAARRMFSSFARQAYADLRSDPAGLDLSSFGAVGSTSSV